MRFEGENGFKSKIDCFIKADITGKGRFGSTYLSPPAHDAQPEELMQSLVEDSTIKELVESVTDNDVEIAEAASRLKLKERMDGVMTGKQLASLISALHFVKHSPEASKACGDIQSMHISGELKMLWEETNRFPLKAKGKTSAFHEAVCGMIRGEDVSPKHVVNLARYLASRSTTAKALSTTIDTMYESLKEVQGIAEEARKTIAIDPQNKHDISQTIPHQAPPPSRPPIPSESTTPIHDVGGEEESRKDKSKDRLHTEDEKGLDIDPLEAFARVFKKSR